MTSIEIKLAKANGVLDKLYGQRIAELIRERYSMNDELAILRQRDSKPEEFAEYNAYVEQCKVEAKEEVNGN
jgi:hypothetical protein